MTARETRRADELTIGDHIYDHTVKRIEGAHTVHGRTTLIDADGESWRVVAGTNYLLATDEEIADQQRERDQRTVGNALRALGSAIVDRRLPVPAGGRGVVVSFDLADDVDLKPWEQWLSKRPRRGTSRPLIQAEAEGVEVYVYGPGTSGEFGPDLADAAITEAERRDAVGAFPVVGAHEAEAALEDGYDGPLPYGYAPATGHATQLDTEALQHSRDYNGETE